MSDLASVLPVPPRALPVQHRRPAEALHLRRMRIEASDEELMLRYGRGDARAFELLYRRHRLPLYRFLLRQVGNAATAEELFQDLWMRVVNSRGRYEARAKFTSWVYAIAHNRLMDFYRGNGQASFLSHEESESVLEDTPAAELAAHRTDPPFLRGDSEASPQVPQPVVEPPSQVAELGRALGPKVVQAGSSPQPAG